MPRALLHQEKTHAALELLVAQHARVEKVFVHEVTDLLGAQAHQVAIVEVRRLEAHDFVHEERIFELTTQDRRAGGTRSRSPRSTARSPCASPFCGPASHRRGRNSPPWRLLQRAGSRARRPRARVFRSSAHCHRSP